MNEETAWGGQNYLGRVIGDWLALLADEGAAPQRGRRKKKKKKELAVR